MSQEKFKDISTNEIEEELVRRSKTLVFLHVSQDPAANTETIGWRYKGERVFCIGLAETLKTYIKENVKKP